MFQESNETKAIERGLTNHAAILINTIALIGFLSLVIVSNSVGAQMINDNSRTKVHPLPMTDVVLTGGPLKHAQDITSDYLLSLDVDRLVAPYRVRAGLGSSVEGYGGWESVNGKQLTGHIAGHYLSACSIMYAKTGDKRFLDRVNHLVRELQLVQDARGDGYLGANADSNNVDGAVLMKQVAGGDIRSGGFDLNGLWAPWYTYHKTYAGLRDAYRYCGNKTALEMEIKFACWAESILQDLPDEQIQKMLGCEFGGMNEVLVDLYEDTGDKRWLSLSHKFEHGVILNSLIKGHDSLPGTHANTQVPKLIGSLDRYIAAGDHRDWVAADFFWDRVVGHHTFVTGGHGQNEYFFQPNSLGQHFEGRTAESCNVYNMLKLTRRMFQLDPDPKYAVFIEQALFNHALASIHPETASMTYMVPVGQYVRREYSDMQHSFTCCVGSGMENHGLHSEGMFYEQEDSLWITFYAPAKANWVSQGVRIEVETDLPIGESVRIKIATQQDPNKFKLKLIRPAWAVSGFQMTINGEPRRSYARQGSFIEIEREWSDGDFVELVLPKQLEFKPMDDKPSIGAVTWGPLVMAGDLSDAEKQGRDGEYLRLPVLIEPNSDISKWLEPSTSVSGRFVADESVIQPYAVEFEPFYRLHGKPYTVYWDTYSKAEWDVQKKRVQEEQRKAQALQSRTVAYIQLGEQQPEQDHQLKYAWSTPTRTANRPGRYATQWITIRVPVDPDIPNTLSLTYFNGKSDKQQKDSKFEILIDGVSIAKESILTALDETFYEKAYALPLDATKGKKTIELKLQTIEGGLVGPIYGIRMLRGENDE